MLICCRSSPRIRPCRVPSKSTISTSTLSSSSFTSSSSLLVPLPEESQCLLPKGQLNILISQLDGGANETSLAVSNLGFSFENKSIDEAHDGQKHHLDKEFVPRQSRRILFQDLSFQLAHGGSAVVRGPSGVGKSTLLRTLAGLAVPDDGIIELAGERISLCQDMTAWRRHMLYVPQTKVEIPGTPLDFLQKICSFALRVHDSPDETARMKERVVQLVKAWGVNQSLLDSEWKTLSGGESQKMLLAVAMASRPKVILLDESTSAMDPVSKICIEASVKEYSAQYGMCAIWITHDHIQGERITR